MKPAVDFGGVAATYLVGVALAAVALVRILDPALLPSTHSTGEAVAWFLAFFGTGILAIVVYRQTEQTAKAESDYTLHAVACQAQRNAVTVASAFVWINAISWLLTILMLAKVVHLRDGLTATATLGGPVATVWYWASTLAYLPLPRESQTK